MVPDSTPHATGGVRRQHRARRKAREARYGVTWVCSGWTTATKTGGQTHSAPHLYISSIAMQCDATVVLSTLRGEDGENDERVLNG